MRFRTKRTKKEKKGEPLWVIISRYKQVKAERKWKTQDQGRGKGTEGKMEMEREWKGMENGNEMEDGNVMET